MVALYKHNTRKIQSKWYENFRAIDSHNINIVSNSINDCSNYSNDTFEIVEGLNHVI